MRFQLEVGDSSQDIPPAVMAASMVISNVVSAALRNVWPGPVTDAQLNLRVNGIKLAFKLER